MISLTLFSHLLGLSLVALNMVVCCRGVVGSHRRVLEEHAEVLGEVRALDHIETLVLVQLTALGQTGRLRHTQELETLLVPNLVLRRAVLRFQLQLTNHI